MSKLLEHLETKDTGKCRLEPYAGFWVDMNTERIDDQTPITYTQRLYRKTLTVGTHFHGREGEFNQASANADRMLVRYMYKDAVDYLYLAKRAIYERDAQAAVDAIDALLKELIG